MKVIIDDKIPFIKGALEPFAEVVYLPGAKTGPEDVKDADALITRTRTICNEKLLAGSAVKMIATATIGFDHIDTQWVEANGIEWTNAPGCTSWSVKQYISSVLVRLALKHGLNLSEMTVGVVGVGNVGSKVAVAAKALGCKVLLCDPPRARKEGRQGFVELEEIIASANIITLHVPLEKSGQDATWHLFDEARLAQLRPDQILINSSRGPVVDNPALKAVLLRGAIKAAVLDVWEGEPNLDRELVDLLDFATPHIAGYSADGKANGSSMSVQALARHFGLPLTDWKASIPQERDYTFTLDASGKDFQQAITEAVLKTYDVQQDSDNLRAALDKFEYLRGNYPIRREPGAYSVKLVGGSEQLRAALEQLDFNII